MKSEEEEGVLLHELQGWLGMWLIGNARLGRLEVGGEWDSGREERMGEGQWSRTRDAGSVSIRCVRACVSDGAAGRKP